MKIVRSNWFPILLGIIILWVVIDETTSSGDAENKPAHLKETVATNEWKAPDMSTLGNDSTGDLVRYGRELIANTARYFGPKGSIKPITNGMNCQNCHIEAGSKPFGNCFAAVASTYPRFRERSGRIESIEFRINDCLERSLDGKKIDSLSKEMRAMVAYLKWIGKDVPRGVKPVGAGTADLAYLERAANPAAGKAIYVQQCQRCHGTNGEGQLVFDSITYAYPPLWGPHSYNVGAGLYRLSRLASYVKDNMPFGIASHGAPQLTDEEAWDVAAFINSQPRPEKVFPADWPNIKTKPVDHPFGPYADAFSENQHKYGPFQPIAKAKEAKKP